MPLASIESRPKEKLKSKTKINLFEIINNIFMIFILPTSGFIIVSFLLSVVSYINSSFTIHPTSIPWIDNQAKCNKSGRDWHENKCFDDEHSPMF
jgi:hypothetical protein